MHVCTGLKAAISNVRASARPSLSLSSTYRVGGTRTRKRVQYLNRPPRTCLQEFEATVGNLRPGVLSDALREALGMGENTPPPWLINMQRYGPPPSYPDLKVCTPPWL